MGASDGPDIDSRNNHPLNYFLDLVGNRHDGKRHGGLLMDKQAEALRLAQLMDAMDFEDTIDAATELRRLRAQVVELEAELVAEAARTAEQKLRADQMSRQHDTQAALNREARNQLAQLTAQLEDIGAGGVESLRKK